MSIGGTALLLVATTALAVVPIGVLRTVQAARERWLGIDLPILGWTATIEAGAFAAAGGVLLFAPDPLPIHWHVPTIPELVLVLAFPPILFASGAALATLSSALGLVDDADDASVSFDPPGRLVSWVTLAFLSVGPAEELLFRGVVQGLLVDSLGPWVAIGAMSVQFGLFHYPNSAGSIREIDLEAAVQMAMSGSGGIYFGVAYLLTGNLLVTILGHSLHVCLIYVFVFGESEDDPETDPGGTTGDPA